MPSELACFTPSAPALAAIDSAGMQMRRVSDRILSITVAARQVAASTDWQTPAARAFFALARRLAEDVVGLAPMSDAVMGEIALARSRVAVENSWDCR